MTPCVFLSLVILFSISLKSVVHKNIINYFIFVFTLSKNSFESFGRISIALLFSRQHGSILLKIGLVVLSYSEQTLTYIYNYYG